MWSLSDWREDFEARRDAAGAAAGALAKELQPIGQRIVDHFCELAAGEIRPLEAADAAAAERFGQTYEPTPLVKLLREACDHARARGVIPVILNAPLT
ncbi:MAG: hypothetical protein NT154_01975 [Verrucomicrobia bacterium]|nr:hypothetical protein [Verrucomicrobiota bacterium]